jgi:hypothetical protein
VVKIVHNSFPELGGGIQSLGLKPEGSDLSIMSLGIVLPGRYYFGVAERHENITFLERFL